MSKGSLPSHRSMNTQSVYSLLSKDSIIWSTNCATAWPVELTFWKPNCLEYKILFSIKYLNRRLYIIRSSIWSMVIYVTIVLTLINRSNSCYVYAVWKNTIFSWEIKLMFQKFTQTAKEFLSYTTINIVIVWSFIAFWRIESIFQFIHWKWFYFHRKIWLVSKGQKHLEFYLASFFLYL